MKSLRGQLAFFWVLLFAVCVSLGVVMLVLFRQSAGAQIADATGAAERACSAIASRYAKSTTKRVGGQPQLDLLNVVLRLVLIETPHVEGGVWSRSGTFVAYAYPTYEGSSVKRDVPEAEQAHIAELAGLTAERQRQQTDVVRASREALIVSACPLADVDHALVAWTMTRTPTGLLDAQESLRIGLGVLLAAVLASAVWLGLIILQGWRELRKLESRVEDDSGAAAAEPIPPTGLAELDRIVAALNRSRRRSVDIHERLRESERQRARDQRLATLGRMTGGIAHEIRNPIAAMRLKAENALASPAAASPLALQAILGQIERLDALVQRLLATVQPLTLDRQPIPWDTWLRTRLEAFDTRASSKGVQLIVDRGAENSPASRAELYADPLHLGRAIDNLIDNAIRHARSAVHLSVDARPAEAIFRIADDGSGIPEGLREHLFEPFATGRHDGTGLGLAIAHEVALAHGGDLRYVPEARGATFEMSLPWQSS